MIPVIPTFPSLRKITLCSVLWRFCDLWPQDTPIGTAATVRRQDRPSGVPEAPTTGLAGHIFHIHATAPGLMRGATVLSAQCSIAWRLWSLHLGNQLQCASMLSAVINGFWRMEHNTSCSTGIESVPVALVGLAIKLWQHKCQSPAEPLSLLGLGFQLWKHLMQPAGPLEASKSSCCTAQPIGLHNERPQILHPAVHSASVGQHHIYDLVQNVAGICAVPLPGTLCA